MEFKSIAQHIVREATADDITLLVQAIKTRQSLLQAREVHKFSIGDKVMFVARGGTIRGTITKINQKTVRVATSQGDWRVAPSLLFIDDATAPSPTSRIGKNIPSFVPPLQ